ncbi:MAG: sulfotransferase domain-containing protein [Rhizomicrobium sp.]
MPISFDLDASNAVFSLPNITGKYDAQFGAYLRKLGAQRPLVMFAFPPKAAGTFLRSAAVEAVDGQLMRITHAQGGRDATPYLPTFILYFAGGFPASTLVTHLHMQALPANRFLMEAFDLKPVIMIRDVADMLTSYWDMLDRDQSSDNWLNCQLPANFAAMDNEAKADFMIDMLGPWYASYFATWLSYAEEAPNRVCVLRYPDFSRDPAGALQTALRHARIERSCEECRRAIDVTWQEREQHRFNKGLMGRGHYRFKPHHMERLERMLFVHYGLSRYRDELLPR